MPIDKAKGITYVLDISIFRDAFQFKIENQRQKSAKDFLNLLSIINQTYGTVPARVSIKTILSLLGEVWMRDPEIWGMLGRIMKQEIDIEESVPENCTHGKANAELFDFLYDFRKPVLIVSNEDREDYNGKPNMDTLSLMTFLKGNS